MNMGWLDVAGLAQPANGLLKLVIGALVVVAVAFVVVVVVGAFVVVVVVVIFVVVVVVGAFVVVVVIGAFVVVVDVEAVVALVVAVVVVALVVAVVVVALVVAVVVVAFVVAVVVVAFVVVVVLGDFVVVVVLVVEDTVVFVVIANCLSATAEVTEISSFAEQSHATSEPAHTPFTGSQKLPSPTTVSQSLSEASVQGCTSAIAGMDRLINAILNILPTIFSKMEIVNEENFKTIIRSSPSWSSGKSALIHRDGRLLIYTDFCTISVWFERPGNTNVGDVSPSENREEPAGPHFRVSCESAPLGLIAHIAKGPSLRGAQKGIFCDSLVLLPFGTSETNGRILSTDVFSSDRLLIACVLSSGHLLLSTESPHSENCPFAPVIFNIETLLPISSLKSPGTVHIWSNGSRVFVTDGGSDLVLEIRFDFSLVEPQRGCPEFSLINWYLESALPVGPNTRVSLVNPHNSSPSGTPCIQIIGTSSNGDSQGVVRLVNQRRWFTSSLTPPCSISFAHNCVLVNTPKYLKLVHLNTGPDFPLTIRPPATNTALAPSGAYFCLYAGIISSFRVSNDDNGVDPLSIVPLSLSGLTECVDSFAIDPVVGHNAVIIVRGDPTVLRVYEIGLVQTDHVQFTFVSQHSLPSPVSCLSINQFGEWICIAADSSVCSNCPPIQSVVGQRSSFINVAICDDWFALVYTDTRNSVWLDFHVMHSPENECSHLQLPPGIRIDQLRFESVILHGRKQKILYGITGHVGVLSRDFFEGSTWVLERLGQEHTNSLCVLKDSETIGDLHEAVFVDTTAPYRVYESCIGSLPIRSMSAIVSSLAASVDTENFRSEISWAILPDALRSRIEPLIALEKFPDTVRSTDSACRRYLIEFAFSREFPGEMRLSTEALAWAGISESQAFILQEIMDPQTVSWSSLVQSGIGFWCTEIGSLKAIVESIQKSALTEYMKSKDPQILEDKVAVWLCALGKQQLLSTLYKQYGNSCASPVHVKIGQFLATDFSDPENSIKAKKNAFELLRQKRYYLAVSMFILGGSVREALDVCCRKLDDVQLALFLAKVLKVVGNRADKDESIDPLIDYIWNDRIIPYADRWMSLLYSCSRLELGRALEVLESPQGQSNNESNLMSRLFSIPNFDLTRHSALRLIVAVKERMRRLNRPCEYNLPTLTSDEVAASYLARGLPGLAQTILRESHNSNEYLTRAIELEISH